MVLTAINPVSAATRARATASSHLQHHGRRRRPRHRPILRGCPCTPHTRWSSTPAAAQLATNKELSAIVEQFPSGIDFSFGYGSGVLSQQQTGGPGMIDVILAVDDPQAWHAQNLQRHADHYSLLARTGGPRFVTWLQGNFGAKIYFHPFVNIEIPLDEKTARREIKYGVVATDDLVRDLMHWDYLYLAGRMHKPIVPVDCSLRGEAGRRDEIEEAQRANLLSAVSASLLLSKSTDQQSFPIGHLYNKIASLSYTGDFRMKAGAEDPDKVKKLVETPGMRDLWDEKYVETLSSLQRLGLLSVADARNSGDGGEGKRVECNPADSATRKHLVQNLPQRLRAYSDQIVGSEGERNSMQQGSGVLRRELANIVAPAAKAQSVKGFFTAGVWKSGKYALAKLSKGWLQR